MANAQLPSQSSAEMLADDLLYGFDIRDEESREFLRSLVSTDHAPQLELEELQQLSLMRGIEEWDMLLDCASVLQENSTIGDDLSAERSLLPFIDAVLTGQAGHFIRPKGKNRLKDRKGKLKRKKEERIKRGSRKNGLGKSVSYFWGDPSEGGNEDGASRRHKNTLDVTYHNQQVSQPTNAVLEEPVNEMNETLECVSVPEVHLTTPASSERTQAALPGKQDVASNLDSRSQSHDAHNDLLSPSRASSLISAPQQQQPNRPTKPRGSKSPFFAPSETPTTPRSTTTTPSPKKKTRPPAGTISSLPIPPLFTPTFGLIQEELAPTPFRLLIAVTFLIKTSAKTAIPVFQKLMEMFPTPEALAGAEEGEVVEVIKGLGLGVVRARILRRIARGWVEAEPRRGVRYGVRGYPIGDEEVGGRGVRIGEVFGAEDDDLVEDEDGDGQGDGDGESKVVNRVVDARERGVGCAWEVGHLTQGAYALDSWRIFCRDVLLGRAEDWTGNGAKPGFQPEWMRVLPRDKELRACLRWMWMKEGWEWDPVTGEREPLRDELRRAVDEGRVGYDNNGNLVILDQVEHTE